MEPARNGADPLVVNNIIGQIKSKGIFDQFRRDCLADVDTKPAYQNLRQRVEGYVSNYLGQHKWEPGMNKNQLRDSLRRQINQSEMLATGVERIIEQVVEPKIQHIFRPQIERLVKETLNPNYKAETSTANDNADNRADIVAPPPEAPPPDLPSAALPPPPPPEDEDDDGAGGDDMDISTPSPTSSPDIHLDSPVEEDEDEYHVQSPPPIPGVETDEAVDFVIGQTIETSEVPITIELETSSDLPPEEMPTDPRLQLSPSPSPQAETVLEEEVVTDVIDDSTLIKQTEQMQVDDDIKTNNDAPSEAKSANDDEEDNLIIAEDGAGSKVKKRDRGADSDGESGLSDITVSSVHTSDLSSFDEEISSSSSSEESESDQSSESSFSDKLSDDSKKGVSRLKSPRKSQSGEVVEMPFRKVKLAHRGKGWFLDKYIYVKNRETSEKIFLRCQHKYLCKAIAYIDKATDKAYVKPGNHVHPPPDVRKINFGTDMDSKKGKKDKSKKTADSSSKGERKIASIKLAVPKPASPQSAKEQEDVISKKEDIGKEPSQTDEDEDKNQPSTSAAVPRVQLTPEQKKAEAERWAAYYEYSIAPDFPERRHSTKALALSRYHSDSEDEDTREERRKKAASDKEERLRRRQERRDSGLTPMPTRRSLQARRELREKNQEETDEERRHPPESPVKATKAQLKEQKILEKKREMRRQRSLNKRYFSEDFSSPVQENLKESLRVGEDSAATSSSEIKPVTPIKRPAPEKIKPVIVSFHLRFRERRRPQVESHFLLCSCLSGEQQKKMSSRKQKQKSKRAGKRVAKFSFISKIPGEKLVAKKAAQQQTQRGRAKKTEEEGVGSDVSRSSTPVQDEIPMETPKEEKPKRGRGRPRKVDEQGQGQDQSRSSTPVQDEMTPMIYGVASSSAEVKEEPVRRTRRRPRKYGDDDQEDTSRPSTPVQEIVEAGSVEAGTPGSAQRRRGRPRKTPVEEIHVDKQVLDREQKPVVEAVPVKEQTPVEQGMPVEEQTPVEQGMAVEEQTPVEQGMPVEEQTPVVEDKADDYSRSSTPVQDEHILEDMEIDQGVSSVLNNVVVQSEQALAQNEQVVIETQQTVSQSDQSLVYSEPVVDSEPSALVASEPVAQPPAGQTEASVIQSELPVAVTHQETTPVQAEQSLVQAEQPPAQGEQPVVQQVEAVSQSERLEPAEEMEVDPTTASEEAVVAEMSQDTEVAKDEVERMDEEPVSKVDTKEHVAIASIVTKDVQDDKGPSVKPRVTRNFWEALAMKTDFIIVESSESKEETQEVDKGDEMSEKDDVVESPVHVDSPVTQEEKPEEERMSRSTAETEDVKKANEEVTKVSEEVTKVSEEQIGLGDKVDSSSTVAPDENPPREDIKDEQNPEGIEKEATEETEVEMELDNLDKEDKDKDRIASEEGTLDETKPEIDVKTVVSSPEEPALALKETPDKDSPVEEAADEKIHVTDSAESNQEEVPRPVLGHSPTPEDEVKGEEGKQDDKEASLDKAEEPEKSGEDTPVDGIEELTVPNLGSSPTAKVEEEATETDMEETKRDSEEDKTVEDVESEKKEEKEEESLVIPALGNSPTQTSNDDEKDDDDDEKKEVDTEESPPTPTQDEPSSMDEISAKEPDTDEDKPAIPIYAVSSPSKSPLGGLFVSRSVSHEGQSGPSSMQSSPAAARSLAGESSGAETNADSEESAPSVSRETRQRPKRRVSTAQDADFEYSTPKRLRGSETPPLPVLEPELPIERPEEETRTRTTRASKQRHISPPHQPTPKDSGVRTRHQSSQSTESQQSTRTPSPVPEQRVTRGRRSSTRQGEEKQSHRYSDMVYYDTGRKSQRQQASSPPAPAPARRSTRRSTDDKSAEKPTRAERKR